MHDGANGDRLIHGIDTDVVLRQLPNEGQVLVDQLLSEVPQVEVDVVPVGALKRAPLLVLLHVAAGEDVARPELHLAVDRLVRRRAEAVVLEIPVAVLVLEIAALPARGFRDEDAGAGQARRVILDELHVLQRRARAVGQRHAVTGLDGRVGRERKDAAAAAGAEDDRLGRDRAHRAVLDVERHDAAHLAVLHQEGCREPLVVPDDAVVLQRGLEQGMEHVEAGLVGRIQGPVHRHAPEGADADTAVGIPAPRAAPVLDLDHLARSLFDEGFHDVLVGQEVAPENRVLGVGVEAVVVPHDRGSPALGGHRVAAHRIHLREDRDGQPVRRLGRRDGSPEAGSASPDHQHVVLIGYVTGHIASFPPRIGHRRCRRRCPCAASARDRVRRGARADVAHGSDVSAGRPSARRTPGPASPSRAAQRPPCGSPASTSGRMGPRRRRSCRPRTCR